MNKPISQGFIRGIETNLVYWQANVAGLTDERIKELRDDQPNLLRAVEFGLVLANTQHRTADLTLQAFSFIEQGGQWESWIVLFERLLADIPSDDLMRRFNLYKRLGQLFRFTGQITQAITIHQMAMEIAQQLNDPHIIADAYLNLSEAYRLHEAYEKAEEYGTAALELFTTLPGAERWLVATLNTLGLAAWAIGNLEKAESRLQEALARGRAIEQPTPLARMLNNLGLVQQARNKFPEAHTCYQEALNLLANTASELDKAKVWLSLGSLQFTLGEWNEAEASFRQADSLVLRQSGDTYLRAALGQNLGNVLLKKGRYIESEAYLQRSLLLWRSGNYPLMLANTLGTWAEAVAAQGRLGEACSAYQEALMILENYPVIAWAKKLQGLFLIEREKLRVCQE